MKKIIILLILFFSVSVFSQTELAIRVIDASGDPVAGLTSANIKFRISPYGAGNVLTIAVTESGTQGNYICTGFTTFQLVKLYINDIEQTWFGQQYSGDPGNTFVDQSTNETIAGDKTITGTTTITGNIISTGQVFFDSPFISSEVITPTSDMLVWKSWVTNNFIQNGTLSLDSFFVIRDNRLFVDSKLSTDIAGIQYNDISSAITYAAGVVGSSSQWTIYILPAHGGLYIESVNLPDYVHLVGIGQVGIRGAFGRTGSVAMSSRIENLYIEVYDANAVINRTKAYNCIFQTFVDAVSGGIISITASQMKDCGFFANYDDVGDDIVSGQNNTIINCIGNHPVSWFTNDKVLGYEYNETAGFTYNY